MKKAIRIRGCAKVTPLFNPCHTFETASPFAHGERREQGFDKVERLGKERGGFGRGKGTFLQKGSLPHPSPSQDFYNRPQARRRTAGGAGWGLAQTSVGLCGERAERWIEEGRKGFRGRAAASVPSLFMRLPRRAIPLPFHVHDKEKPRVVICQSGKHVLLGRDAVDAVYPLFREFS